MRIAHFTNSYKPTISGVVTSISNFRKGLLNNGEEVQIFAPKYNGFVDQEPFIFRFPAIDLNEMADISLILPIINFIKPTIMGVKPDIIHSHHPILMGDMAATIAQELNIPLVFTFHTRYEKYIQDYLSLVPELSGKIVETIVRRYLEKCSLVIAPTKHIQEQINSYNIDVPVPIIPSPIDLQKFQNLHPKGVRDLLSIGDEDLLMYLGRLSPEKNLEFLISAFAMIHAERSNCKLVIAGDGPIKDQLGDQAKAAQINEAVVFTGAIPHKNVPHFMAAADLFVFPSTNETQGLVLLEALAANTPVVAVDSAVNADILSEGSGILVDENKGLFTEAVLSVFDEPALMQALKQTANVVTQRYQLNTAVEKLIEVYRNISDQ
jgi:glycosyltransferase involved in cell wall biosynthesis